MAWVRVGRVVRAVGLKGHLGVAGLEGALGTLGRIVLKRGEQEAEERSILEARPRGRIWVVRIEGIADRTSAEAAVGAEVLAAREDLGEAGQGRHYWTDLEGLPVVTAQGEDVGRVTGFYDTGGVDVLVVTGGDRREMLVPLAPYVEVDLAAGRIVVDPPEGLLEAPSEPGRRRARDEGSNVAKLEVEILTLFPRACAGYLGESILGKAQEAGLLSVRVQDVREHAAGKHKVTDDAPYGGGAGMVMKPEPLTEAIEAARARLPGALAIITSPRGVRLDQALAKRLADHGKLILVCGRYEGVDERVMAAIDMMVSLGDFVLTGGELAALCVVDATARLVPGVLGNEASAGAESFAGDVPLLEHPHYTRPPEFRGMRVPGVLLSGDHRRIERWRRRESLRATRERRPDLFARARLSEDDLRLIDAGDDEL